VYLGLGPNGVALCRALRASGWTVPVIGNIGLGVFPEPDLEGVVFTDVVDEENPVLQRFAQRWRTRFGQHPVLLGLAAAHDLAITAVAALRPRPTPTPGGEGPRPPPPRRPPDPPGGGRATQRLPPLGPLALQGPPGPV